MTSPAGHPFSRILQSSFPFEASERPFPIRFGQLDCRTFAVFPILAGTYLWGRRNPEPAAMVLIFSLIYVLQHDSEHEYSLWALLPLAASGFCDVSMPDRILCVLPWLFGGIWLSLREGWTLIRYLHRHPRLQVMEPLPK